METTLSDSSQGDRSRVFGRAHVRIMPNRALHAVAALSFDCDPRDAVPGDVHLREFDRVETGWVSYDAPAMMTPAFNIDDAVCRWAHEISVAEGYDDPLA